MRPLFEYDLVQNSAIGAVAMHAAILQCYESSGRMIGMPLPQSMLVLPLVFHRRTRSTISKMMFSSSFYRALVEQRTIPVGLQHRMESMQKLSLSAVNLAFGSSLIKRNPKSDDLSFVPSRLSPVPFGGDDVDTKDIIPAAKRVGYWIATVKFETMCSLLCVRF